MKQLFSGRFAPVTFSVAFFRIPFNALVGEYFAWTKGNFGAATLHTVCGALEDGLAELAPLSAPSDKELLFGAGQEWTAYFSNGLSGGNAFSRAPYWSGQLGIDAVALSLLPDHLDKDCEGAYGKYRSMQIQIFQRDLPGNTPRRTLCSMRDGNGWFFMNEGVPYAFENISKYSLSRIRDRVSPEDILAFCNFFGFPLIESGFSGPGAIISTCGGSSKRQFSYNDARTMLGIGLFGTADQTK